MRIIVLMEGNQFNEIIYLLVQVEKRWFYGRTCNMKKLQLNYESRTWIDI